MLASEPSCHLADISIVWLTEDQAGNCPGRIRMPFYLKHLLRLN